MSFNKKKGGEDIGRIIIFTASFYAVFLNSSLSKSQLDLLYVSFKTYIFYYSTKANIQFDIYEVKQLETLK